MSKNIARILMLLSAVFIGAVPMMVIRVASAMPAFTSYAIPTASAAPQGITTGPDGALWFAESDSHKIGRISLSGSLTEFSVSSYSQYGASINNVATGRDGALWFIDGNTTQVERMTTDGSITRFNVPTSFTYSDDFFIAAGADGALWFTLSRSNEIGRISTSGSVTEYPVPTPNADPNFIVSGPDGALWFGEASAHQIGRINSTGTITEFPIPSASEAGGLATGPDGALWFTDGPGNSIGRITTAGNVTMYPIPTANTGPENITPGPDGALWFGEYPNSLGRITTAGDITEYPMPATQFSPAVPWGITLGPDNALWITDFDANTIVRALPDTAPSAPTALTIPSPAQHSVLSWSTVSGATSYNIYRGGMQIDATTDTTYTDNTAPEGIETYFVTAVNGGGESQPSDSVNVVVDRTAPNVVGTPDRSPNSSGWYNQDIAVNWTSTDLSPSSGAPTQPPPIVAGLEGDNTYTSDQSCDPAGNCATGSLELKIDTTPPIINDSVAPTPNIAGWNNGDVTVTFTCVDAVSGIAICPSPVTVGSEGADQTVIGTATDFAGNTATASVRISLDRTAPNLSYALNQTPNANGWFKGTVTVQYICTDALSGVASCPADQTESADGIFTLSGTAVDNAGNTTGVVTQLNIDTTPPAVSAPIWSANPLALGGSTTFTTTASDTLSGVVQGEYFIGADPGKGNGTAMPVSNGALTATLGAGLGVGVYSVGIRAQDAAGNWSPTTTTMLVIYDPSTSLRMIGKNKRDLVPSLANGDLLPGLISATQTDSADFGFTVEYKNGALDNHNDFMFTYTTGTNCGKPSAQDCHSFMLNATSFAWLIIDQTNSSRGQFQGIASVTIDGVTTTSPFTVTGIDGARLTPAADDSIVLKVYAPGADPSTATPVYQASGSMAGGNAVKIQ